MSGQATPDVVVVMLGARMHYAVPRILHESGMLKRFYTDSYIGNKPRLETTLKLIPTYIRPAAVQRWLGRKESVLPSQKIDSFELFGWQYFLRRKYARFVSDDTNVHAAAGRSFNKRIIAAHPPNVDVVWGYDGGALEMFRWARSKDRFCILEQAIAPRRIQSEILSAEYKFWHGWQPSVKAMSYPDALSVREEEEWALADRIVVGSEFVAHGLRSCGVQAAKIQVIPYGVDSQRFGRASRTQSFERLRVLFAGEVGLRKGVPYLLHALRMLGGRVEARFAGEIVLDSEKIAPYSDVASFIGQVPRLRMQELFEWADVFVLPTVCEGSATVIYEALVSGLPVITTPNAGSIVRDGIDGFIVPIRDPDALAAAILKYEEDRPLLSNHRRATMESRKIASFERYQADIVRLVHDVVKCRNL